MRKASDVDRIEYFEALVRESPDEPRARYGYANELFAAGRFAEAHVEYRAYLGLSPDDEGHAFGRLADALAQVGDRDGAADAFLEGIDAALANGHTGLADEFRERLEAL